MKTIDKNVLIGRRIVQLMLFLTIPVCSFFVSLCKSTERYSNIIIVLFWGVLGYTRKLSISTDSAYWTNKMLSYANYGLSDFWREVTDSTSQDSLNILYYFLLYVYAHISTSTSFFWACWFMFSAYLLLKIYRINFDSVKSIGLKEISLFACFLLFIPFSSYGVRFWLSAFLFVYGFFLYNSGYVKKGLFFIFLTPFFHFTFVVMLFMFILWRTTFSMPNIKKIICIVLFLFIAYIVFYYYNLSSFSSAVENKWSYYSDQESRSEYFWAKSWFIILDKFLYIFYAFIFVYYMALKKILSTEYKRMGYFLILLSVTCLVMFNFYDAFDRFTRIFSFMTLCYLIKIVANYRVKGGLIYFGILIYSYHVLVNFLLIRFWLDWKALYLPIVVSLSKGPMVEFINM